MNKTRIVKVKKLYGIARTLAEEQGLNLDDLVILTVSLEKVVGDPASYLLSQVQDSEGSRNE